AEAGEVIVTAAGAQHGDRRQRPRVVLGQRLEVRVGLGGQVDLADDGVPAGAGVLLEDGQQVDELLDGGAGGAEVGVADPLRAVAHERGQRLVGYQVAGRVAAGVDVAELGQQHVEVFGGEVGEPQHG